MAHVQELELCAGVLLPGLPLLLVTTFQPPWFGFPTNSFLHTRTHLHRVPCENILHLLATHTMIFSRWGTVIEKPSNMSGVAEHTSLLQNMKPGEISLLDRSGREQEYIWDSPWSPLYPMGASGIVVVPPELARAFQHLNQLTTNMLSTATM